jgi:RimJ/RimL family protein N-acetyltransferase
MPGPVVLDAEGAVSLHTVEREDVSFLQRWQNQPAVRHWMPRPHPQRERQVVDEFEDHITDKAAGLNLIACLDGERAGYLTLFNERPTASAAELSAWVTPPMRGECIATAGLQAMVDHAFGERGLQKLSLGTLATNEAARAIAEKVGFVEEVHEREHSFVAGEYVDRVVYGMLIDEWRAVREESQQ